MESMKFSIANIKLLRISADWDNQKYMHIYHTYISYIIYIYIIMISYVKYTFYIYP